MWSMADGAEGGTAARNKGLRAGRQGKTKGQIKSGGGS